MTVLSTMIGLGIVKLRASRPVLPQDMVDGASLNPTILGRDSPT